LTPGAYYTVRLHFAEIYHNQVGKRQFNVAINGQPVLTNYDIVSQSGGPNIAIVEEFPAVADALGNLAITLSKGSADNPKISGIELLTSDWPELFQSGLSAIDRTGGNCAALVSSDGVNWETVASHTIDTANSGSELNSSAYTGPIIVNGELSVVDQAIPSDFAIVQ
jgi:hypothetical protein